MIEVGLVILMVVIIFGGFGLITWLDHREKEEFDKFCDDYIRELRNKRKED